MRASTSQGYSSPSEPSDLLALQMEGQASKALPPLPTFLGRGFLLMEDFPPPPPPKAPGLGPGKP